MVATSGAVCPCSARALALVNGPLAWHGAAQTASRFDPQAPALPTLASRPPPMAPSRSPATPPSTMPRSRRRRRPRRLPPARQPRSDRPRRTAASASCWAALSCSTLQARLGCLSTLWRACPGRWAWSCMRQRACCSLGGSSATRCCLMRHGSNWLAARCLMRTTALRPRRRHHHQSSKWAERSTIHVRLLSTPLWAPAAA